MSIRSNLALLPVLARKIRDLDILSEHPTCRDVWNQEALAYQNEREAARAKVFSGEGHNPRENLQKLLPGMDLKRLIL